jgi:hypothetical protein
MTVAVGSLEGVHKGTAAAQQSDPGKSLEQSKTGKKHVPGPRSAERQRAYAHEQGLVSRGQGYDARGPAPTGEPGRSTRRGPRSRF